MPAVASFRCATALLMPAALMFVDQEAQGSANSESEWDVGGAVALVTDYVDRGISQSHGHGAVQGEVLWQHKDGMFASVWASSVDFDDGEEAKAEVDFILGAEREWNDTLLGWSASYIHYAGADSTLNYDLFELLGRAERQAGPLTFHAEAIFSPQGAEESGRALYAVAGVSRELAEELSLGAYLGRQWIERDDIAGPDYTTWGVELSWERGRYSAMIGYSDTDAPEDCGDICDARIAAGVAFAL